LCQYLILAYPAAVIAVVYVFFEGRVRRLAWIAYGLLVVQALFLFAVGAEEMALVILILLGFVAVLGWYDLHRARRASSQSGRPW
jgi:hypothetical protein